MLGRIHENALEYAPKQIEYEGQIIVNPTEDLLKLLGYKELIFHEEPILNEYQYRLNRYTETADTITIDYDVFLISYDNAINNEIKKQYSDSQEFAILRQKDIKPEEYQEYYDYCEACKEKIKQIYNKE